MNKRPYSYYDAVADHLLDGHAEQAKGILTATIALFNAVQTSSLLDAVQSKKPTFSWVGSPHSVRNPETLILHHTEDFQARVFPYYVFNSNIVKLGTCAYDKCVECYHISNPSYEPCLGCELVGECAFWTVQVRKYGAHTYHHCGDWTIGWHTLGWNEIGAFPSEAVAKRFAEELLVMVSRGKDDKESIKELIRDFHRWYA